MNFINKNKKLSIIIGVLALLFLILIIIFIIKIFGTNSNGVYGNRLEGIEEYEIKDNQIDSIKSNIKKTDGVEEVEYNLQGKIVKFTVKIKEMAIEDAKKLVDLIVLSKKQVKYYDVQLLVLSDDESYPLFGYKNKSSADYTFTYNKVGETSE